MINYEEEVTKVYPDATHIFFRMSEMKHHIRVYGQDDAPYGKSIGKGDTEHEAWVNTYNNLKNTKK